MNFQGMIRTVSILSFTAAMANCSAMQQNNEMQFATGKTQETSISKLKRIFSEITASSPENTISSITRPQLSKKKEAECQTLDSNDSGKMHRSEKEYIESVKKEMLDKLQKNLDMAIDRYDSAKNQADGAGYSCRRFLVKYLSDQKKINCVRKVIKKFNARAAARQHLNEAEEDFIIAKNKLYLVKCEFEQNKNLTEQDMVKTISILSSTAMANFHTVQDPNHKKQLDEAEEKLRTSISKLSIIPSSANPRPSNEEVESHRSLNNREKLEAMNRFIKNTKEGIMYIAQNDPDNHDDFTKYQLNAVETLNRLFQLALMEQEKQNLTIADPQLSEEEDVEDKTTKAELQLSKEKDVEDETLRSNDDIERLKAAQKYIDGIKGKAISRLQQILDQKIEDYNSAKSRLSAAEDRCCFLIREEEVADCINKEANYIAKNFAARADECKHLNNVEEDLMTMKNNFDVIKFRLEQDSAPTEDAILNTIDFLLYGLGVYEDKKDLGYIGSLQNFFLKGVFMENRRQEIKTDLEAIKKDIVARFKV